MPPSPRRRNPSRQSPRSRRGSTSGPVAAIGVAVGGIATFLTAIVSKFVDLGIWMPIGVLAIMLAISGPSMLIAWLKLRRRNIGPLLDANGWAVNALARINVPFGGALTGVATLPEGATRTLRDPFAEKQRPWRLYFALLVLLVLAGSWLGQAGRVPAGPDQGLHRAAPGRRAGGKTSAPAHRPPI